MKLNDLALLHTSTSAQIDVLTKQIEFLRCQIDRKMSHIKKLHNKMAEKVTEDLPVKSGMVVSVEWYDHGRHKVFGVLKGVRYSISGRLELEMTKVDECGVDTGIAFLPYELPNARTNFKIRKSNKWLVS